MALINPSPYLVVYGLLVFLVPWLIFASFIVRGLLYARGCGPTQPVRFLPELEPASPRQRRLRAFDCSRQRPFLASEIDFVSPPPHFVRVIRPHPPIPYLSAIIC